MRIAFFCFLFAVSFMVQAQNDVNVVLRKPDYLFSGNEKGRNNFLSSKAIRTGFGAHVMDNQYFAWEFRAGSDIAVVSFGENALFHMGFSLEGLADTQNEISFRMAQTHYDVAASGQLALDDNIVLWMGYRHRCRHMSDKIDGRIIMRSGPQFVYSQLFDLGPVDLISQSTLDVYIIGQNEDFSHQPRAFVGSVLQVDWPIVEPVTLFASAGIGGWLVTQGLSKHFLLFSPAVAYDVRFSPSAAAGVALAGKVGEFRTYLSYHSDLDAGFAQKAERIHALAVLLEYWL